MSCVRDRVRGIHDSVPLSSSVCIALMAAAVVACSAPSDADDAPDFQASPSLGGASGAPAPAAPVMPAPGAAPSPTAPSPNEASQGNGAPIAPSAGGNAAPAAPGSATPAAPPPDMGAPMTPPAAGGAPNAPAEPAPTAPVPAPAPPGAAFFSDDFEASPAGAAPPNWDYFVAYVANGNNPSGTASVLVDDTRAFTGTRSVRFSGGPSPAQITLPLPAGTNRLFVRAMVFLEVQLGANPSPSANHETLIGIRGTPGGANDEIRFGEIKGAIGTNEVPSDNISPQMDQWNAGPSVSPNAWHCFEVDFLGDLPQNELHARVDGDEVHAVTAPDQWQNGMLPATWMNGKFNEVIFGWHSFSNVQTNVWMDDIVLSTEAIGCP